MFKKIIAGIIAFIMAISLVSCDNAGKKINNDTKNTASDKNKDKVVKNDNEKLDIVTTNQLVYYMVKDIVKDYQDVRYMFPNEEEQWNYEFTDTQIKNNTKPGDIFIYTGASFEPWISRYIDDVNKSKTSFVNISRGIYIINHDDYVVYNSKTVKENPYYWMNIDDYIIALSNITTALEEKDPENRDFYNDNFLKCKNKLTKYQNRLKDLSDKLSDYTFVVDGDKYDYLLQYCKFKNVKYKLLDTDKDKDKNEDKIKDAQNVVFLYTDDVMLTYHSDIIKKYNIKTVKLQTFIPCTAYTDILEYDISNLEKILSDKKTDKSTESDKS